MANIFDVFKYVRPRKTIKSDDFNGLQDSLKASLDGLGAALDAGAPAGHLGVSTPFHVGEPIDGEHAVTKQYFTTQFTDLAAPELAKCTAEADRAETEADRATAIVLGDVSPELDALQVGIDANTVGIDANTTAIQLGVVGDVSPQLGGNLDAQTNKITNVGQAEIASDALTLAQAQATALSF